METRRPVVLNVDDYEAARYTRTQYLARAGFEVREAGSGAEALDLAVTQPPSIVLLDVNLPDMSGFEVCRRLKHDPTTASVPVVHLSSTFVNPAHRVRGLEGGADGYLTEPVEPAVLIATIRSLLRVREAETERDLLLAREQAARAEAEAANRAKDEFLATVSHELRAPLNTILGWARMLRTDLPEERRQHALETIERNVQHQVRLIDDLLDVSRIIAGKLRLNVQPVHMLAVVQAAVEAVRAAAESKRVTVEADLDPSPAEIQGDPNRLQQVVHNLVSNAVKFTGEGGNVRVSLKPGRSEVRIIVADTGRGITPEFLPHVFDRFRQAETTAAREQDGLGLGLAIVRHLVELHGGSVTAHSDGIGRGATFTVRLPLRADVQDADSEAGATQMPFAFPLSGVRVLLVEDEGDCREVLVAGLQQCGAVVRAVGSAREALAALEKPDLPHVLVSDIGLPGEDGYALIQQVRALAPGRGGDIPAIALTAYTRDVDEAAARDAGYQFHLSKPADLEALAEAIALVLGRRRS